jgi:hypothetical protein
MHVYVCTEAWVCACTCVALLIEHIKHIIIFSSVVSLASQYFFHIVLRHVYQKKVTEDEILFHIHALTIFVYSVLTSVLITLNVKITYCYTLKLLKSQKII